MDPNMKLLNDSNAGKNGAVGKVVCFIAISSCSVHLCYREPERM